MFDFLLMVDCFAYVRSLYGSEPNSQHLVFFVPKKAQRITKHIHILVYVLQTSDGLNLPELRDWGGFPRIPSHHIEFNLLEGRFHATARSYQMTGDESSV